MTIYTASGIQDMHIYFTPLLCCSQNWNPLFIQPDFMPTFVKVSRILKIEN